MSISLAEFAKFLLTAKNHTYAAGGSDTITPLLPGSRQLEYREGDLLYRDIVSPQKFRVSLAKVHAGKFSEP
jgi:hypothetical protein